ncbi:MAG: hypothetical protein IPL61_16055 [Myxococcales bacterium]|nr:hypothetical protein [Myxococcales bacterium]
MIGRAALGLALAAAPAAAAPLTVALAPGVTLDWQRGAVIATGVGPADRNAPSPTVARVGAARAAERAARARLTAAIAAVPAVGGRLDPRAPALARALAAAPVLTIVRGTDGSARVTVVIGVEALRQAGAGPRPVDGDDGAAATVVIDARGFDLRPTVGLAVAADRARWRGPVRYTAAVPDGATALAATAVSADAVTVAAPLPAAGAAVVVVVRPDP